MRLKVISYLWVILLSIILMPGNNIAIASDNGSADGEPKDYGKLKGQVFLENGAPLTEGFVALFSAEGEEHQDYGTSKRSPAMVAFVKPDGFFETDYFPVGIYYLGAVPSRKWMGGPPKSGQKRYSAFDDNGNYMVVTIKGGETIDVGKVTLREPSEFPQFKESFIVKGRVIGQDLKGVPESVVVVKEDFNNPKGLFISQPTGKDGSYELKIPPGKYFFVARKELTVAGRPKPGGLTGYLGQTKPVGLGGDIEEPPAYIIGQDGSKFENIDIMMFTVPIPDVKRQEIEAQVKAKKMDKSTLPDNLPLMKKKAEEGVEFTKDGAGEGKEKKDKE